MGQSSHVVTRGLSHSFTSRQGDIVALSNINLEVERGEFVSIIGPSGGGKTTLLRIAGGLLEPSEGAVSIEGQPPSEAQRRKAIGFVFQDASLLPWRTVLENVRLPLEVNVGRSAADAEGPQGLLEAVGLAEFQDYYPLQLSGGMRQRVALARALAFDPGLLLMDEPFGSLDEMTRTAMRYELLRLWEQSNKTVMFVTHSIPEAVLLSDRVVVMSSRPGRVLRELRIELPRPREESLELTTPFLEYVRQIKEGLSTGEGDGASPIKTPTRI